MHCIMFACYDYFFLEEAQKFIEKFKNGNKREEYASAFWCLC